jgi:hypothetical protein
LDRSLGSIKEERDEARRVSAAPSIALTNRRLDPGPLDRRRQPRRNTQRAAQDTPQGRPLIGNSRCPNNIVTRRFIAVTGIFSVRAMIRSLRLTARASRASHLLNKRLAF